MNFPTMRADEVRFPREVKMCEMCGASFIRIKPFSRFKDLAIVVTEEKYCAEHRKPQDQIVNIRQWLQ